MRIIETKIFTFEELSDKAKEKAREWWRQCDDYDFGEAIDSLKKFADYFGITISDYRLDAYAHQSYVRFSKQDLADNVNIDADGHEIDEILSVNETLKGLISDDKFLSGNCPFTGMFWDEELLYGIRSQLSSPDSHNKEDLNDCYRQCFENLFSAIQKDYEYQMSDEAVDGNITANDYEFTEEGKRYV
jgi:hypothetical protein